MISFDVIDQYVEQKQATNRGITHINESTYVASNEEAVVKTAVINLEKASYFVIGGCFSEKENAETFVSQLQEQGFDAVLVDKNKGLHRVAFGGYASRKAAKKALHKITASGEHSAWVLKKS
jgi:cell division protein FtsN